MILRTLIFFVVLWLSVLAAVFIIKLLPERTQYWMIAALLSVIACQIIWPLKRRK